MTGSNTSACGATPISAGPFTCSVLKGDDIVLHVSKPIPTMTTLEQCRGIDVSNTASATYSSIIVGTVGLDSALTAEPIGLPVDNSNTTIHVPADTSQVPRPAALQDRRRL